MKIFWIVLAVLVVALATFSLVNYLLQRRKLTRAEKDGVAVYATVLSIEPVGGWAKYLEMHKIVMRVQEPGETVAREVTLRTRLAPGQKIVPGVKLAVTVDPTNPKRVYPAGPEASKRVVLTGSRQERRQMKAQRFERQVASSREARRAENRRTPRRTRGV